jgi:outer membrane murein-binding lipoprotein Lpp
MYRGMTMSDEFMRFMAAWALVHESADEGWKAAVERGSALDPAAMEDSPDAFVDALSAAIAEEKERLKASLAEGGASSSAAEPDLIAKLDDLSFEVGELRGRIESLQTSVDALADDTSVSGADGGGDSSSDG